MQIQYSHTEFYRQMHIIRPNHWPHMNDMNESGQSGVVVKSTCIVVMHGWSMHMLWLQTSIGFYFYEFMLRKCSRVSLWEAVCLCMSLKIHCNNKIWACPIDKLQYWWGRSNRKGPFATKYLICDMWMVGHDGKQFYFSINQDPKKKVFCTFRTEHEARFFVDIILFI